MIAMYLFAAALSSGAAGATGPSTASAPERVVVTVRPHGGAGLAVTYNGDAPTASGHAGARLLLSAGPLYRYGLEVSELLSDLNDRGGRRWVMGVVLETILFDGYLMGIGTVGYVSSTSRPFGVTTNLGWEPQWRSTFRPFVTFRTDFILDRNITTVMSLNAGLTLSI